MNPTDVFIQVKSQVNRRYQYWRKIRAMLLFFDNLTPPLPTPLLEELLKEFQPLLQNEVSWFQIRDLYFQIKRKYIENLTQRRTNVD